MKAYWTDARPNGSPIEGGTFCRVTDMEDGTDPIYTYGKTKDEVFEKIERNNANAQVALTRAKTQLAAVPAPAPRVISGDEVIRATADLQNPAKAGQAITTLVESATGVNIHKVAAQDFSTRAKEWEREHPEFYAHPGNIELVGREARSRAGGNVAGITKEMLTQSFEDLRARGVLFERSHDSNPSNPQEFPVESPVQRERLRGTRVANGVNGLRLTPASVQPHATRRFEPKYTREQIEQMSIEKSRELIETNDRDYAQACEFWYAEQATA